MAELPPKIDETLTPAPENPTSSHQQPQEPGQEQRTPSPSTPRGAHDTGSFYGGGGADDYTTSGVSQYASTTAGTSQYATATSSTPPTGYKRYEQVVHEFSSTSVPGGLAYEDQYSKTRESPVSAVATEGGDIAHVHIGADEECLDHACNEYEARIHSERLQYEGDGVGRKEYLGPDDKPGVLGGLPRGRRPSQQEQQPEKGGARSGGVKGWLPMGSASVPGGEPMDSENVGIEYENLGVGRRESLGPEEGAREGVLGGDYLRRPLEAVDEGLKGYLGHENRWLPEAHEEADKGGQRGQEGQGKEREEEKEGPRIQLGALDLEKI